MNKVLHFVVISGMLIFLTSSAAISGMTSANYHMQRSVLVSGGSPLSSANYSLKSTAGQPSPVASSASDNYKCFSGFWSYLTMVYLMGDVNGDKEVNLEDIIITLNLLTNRTTTGVQRGADVNGDGRIGGQEAIYILQDVSGAD